MKSCLQEEVRSVMQSLPCPLFMSRSRPRVSIIQVIIVKISDCLKEKLSVSKQNHQVRMEIFVSAREVEIICGLVRGLGYFLLSRLVEPLHVPGSCQH